MSEGELPLVPHGGAASPSPGGRAPDAHCTDGVCITCSDEALPMVVRALGEDGMAVVERDGATAEVSVELVEGAGPGDTVLVHGGVAIEKLERA